MNKQDCTCKSRNGDISDCGCYTEPPSLLPNVVCQKTIASGSGGNSRPGVLANPSKY